MSSQGTQGYTVWKKNGDTLSIIPVGNHSCCNLDKTAKHRYKISLSRERAREREKKMHHSCTTVNLTADLRCVSLKLKFNMVTDKVGGLRWRSG